MTEPDFSNLVSDDKDHTKGTSSSTRNPGDKQVHVKGAFGTKTFVSGDGCGVCQRNATVVLVGVNDTGRKQSVDKRYELSCQHHIGDILGDELSEYEERRQIPFDDTNEDQE